MIHALPIWVWRRSRRPRCVVPLQIESLETRCLPALTAGSGLLEPVAAVEPNDTLDRAQDLGNLSDAGPSAALGAIGDGFAGAADVDWYCFTLVRPTHVTLVTLNRQLNSPLQSVVSLYNSTPFEFSDRFNLLGHRLLAQVDGRASAGDARLERDLAAGTYYVALSGAGNPYFHPFLGDSGYPGSTGTYRLLVTAADLALEADAGPVVLSADPALGAVLSSSPLILRLDLSTALNPDTILPGQNVRLTYNPGSTFGDENDQDIPLSEYNFSNAATELQLTPASPLAPGFYQLFLAGDSSTGNPVLADANAAALGTDTLHPFGQDVTLTFQVSGVEGNSAADATADDTPETAHDLGDLTVASFRLVAGTIGDDPTDPVPFNPSDVDLYHFHLSGPGRYAFLAEVFARRIGSSLNPASSLFRLDPEDGQLHLLTGNDDTRNRTRASDGSGVPLFSDSVLYAGLTAGDYYVAVSARHNVPDPIQNLLPGVDGIFDPQVSHSGQVGATIGLYVLNLRLEPIPDPPQVIAATLAEGDTLAAPPTQLVVHFSAPVNLQQLAFEAYQQTTQATVAPVYIQGTDDFKYFPRLESYDAATSTATFLMLDGLVNGTYQLHLSGPLGLHDFGGNPLVGNDPSGDFVLHFTVQGTPRGTDGTGLQWLDQEPNDTFDQPQDLGVLFPHELQDGISLVADSATPSGAIGADTADFYRFQVLQGASYLFLLRGSDLPAGIQLSLRDAAGNLMDLPPQGDGSGIRGLLEAGTYTLEVGGWAGGQASYEVLITLDGLQDNAPSLTVGPAPALRIRLVNNVPANPTVPPPTETPPQVVVPLPPASSSSPPPAQVSIPTPLARPVSVSLNQDVLLALAAGPVGGVTGQTPRDPAFLSDRVVVQLPNANVVEGLLRLVILTQPSGFSGDVVLAAESQTRGETPSMPALVRSLADVLFQLAPSWQQAPEILSVIENWLELLAVPANAEEIFPEDAASEATSQGGTRLEGSLETNLCLGDSADTTNASDRHDATWAVALALVSTAGGDSRKRRKRWLAGGPAGQVG